MTVTATNNLPLRVFYLKFLFIGKRAPVSLQQIDGGRTERHERHERHEREPVAQQRKSNVIHAPIPAPSVDDMEPQNISFIGNNGGGDERLREGISRLNITSGSRTYRIPSPTRPLISRNVFQPSPPPANASTAEADEETNAPVEISSLDTDPTNQKGFYISFDNDQPKRPKPPLRMKRGSPKKERSYVETPEEAQERRDAQERLDKKRQHEREMEEERLRKEEDEKRKQELIEREREKMRQRREASQERQKVSSASTIIIGNDLSDPDPVNSLNISTVRR